MNKLQEQLENSHKCELENTIKRSNNVRSLYSVGDKFFRSFFSCSLARILLRNVRELLIAYSVGLFLCCKLFLFVKISNITNYSGTQELNESSTEKSKIRS